MKPAGLISSLVVLCLTTAAPAEESLTLDLGDGIKLEMVLVKRGKFQQGSPPHEAGRNDDESLHPVTLTQDFYLGKFPVTRGQFARFVKETGYRTEAERGPSGGFGFDGTTLVQRKEFTWRNPGFRQTDDHPVTLVTYDDALAFTAWLAKKTRRPVTLPTEAQWEYACRAGTTTRFYMGDNDDDARTIAWFKTNAGNGTRPVGQKKSNTFGLYDMSGNVYQWCRDWYGAYPAGAVNDPEETRARASEPPRRVLRGGSWLREARHCRSAARFRNTPGSRNADNGFRVAAPVTTPSEKKDSGRVLAPSRPKESAEHGVSATPHPLVRASNPNGPNQSAGGSRGGSILAELGPGALCPLLFFGGFILIVIWNLRRRVPLDRSPSRQPPRRPAPPARGTRYNTRVVHDGFWLEGSSLRHGSVVHYRYRTGGQWRTGTCPIQPGPQGHFIYTGEQPTDIVIEQVIPPESSGTGFSWEEPGAPASEPLVSEPPATSGESSTSYPSAY
jgi:formylglycine-generating enzyme required for sulfatase activity